MTQPKPERLSAFDLMEAFHLAHAVSVLYDLKILAALRQPATAEAVALAQGLDPVLMRGVLEYVAARTNLLRRSGARFLATPEYSSASRFLLELYGGAYRNNAGQLEKLMRRPTLARGAVDRVRHARAFENARSPAAHPLSALIQQLQFSHVFDIGCGSGALLMELAAQDPKFVGWGLEANPVMCKAARARIRAAGLDKRIRVMEGDSRQLAKILPADVRSRVKTITACQVANEMFGTGTSSVVAWLRGIRKMFPARPFLVSDYYGRLRTKASGGSRETLLHDYAQLISGQGVPPANVTEWRAIYAEAGCRLAYVIEDRATTRFVHVVVLESLG